MAFSFTANAGVVFDFQDLTDTSNGEIYGELADGTFWGTPGTPLNSGEQGFYEFYWDKGGVNMGVYAYAENTPGMFTEAFAYLDSNNAGLGVCSSTDANNQCNPSSDDNVTLGEVLVIDFLNVATIDFNTVIFRNAVHNIFAPTIEIDLSDGNGWNVLDLSATLSSDSFSFRINPAGESSNQFYIDQLTVSVPAPAPLALLGLGLLGLGLSRRRKALAS